MTVTSFIGRIDSAVDAWLAPLRGRPGLDRAAYLASELADYSVGWHLLNGLTTLFAPRLDRRVLEHTGRLAATLGVESALVNGAIKPIFGRQRPVDWENASTMAPRRPKTASFPSGHASSATVAAILLSDKVPTLRPLWWTLALGVAASRVYTRMHHFSDVAAGVVTGALIGRMAKSVWPIR